MAARIFAIVDVWDALISDRHYRLAWPEETAIRHITSLSGRHFDLRVVDDGCVSISWGGTGELRITWVLRPHEILNSPPFPLN